MYHDHYQVCNVSSCAYRFDILHWGYFGYILKSLNSFGLYDRILYGECFSSGTLINIRNSNRRQMSKTQSNTLLCPAYYWVQHITVSSILLSTTHYCVQHITVYNTLLCPAYYCVQHIIVSSILMCQENIMSTFLHMSLLINFSFMILKFSLFSVKYYHKRWVQG